MGAVIGNQSGIRMSEHHSVSRSSDDSGKALVRDTTSVSIVSNHRVTDRSGSNKTVPVAIKIESRSPQLSDNTLFIEIDCEFE